MGEDMEVMVDMDVVMAMERERLMPSQDTAVDMDMVVMAADMDVVMAMAMERGRLMPSQDTAVDMAVMVVMAMEDMVIAVKFFPLFIVPPPIDFFIGLKTKNMNKT